LAHSSTHISLNIKPDTEYHKITAYLRASLKILISEKGSYPQYCIFLIFFSIFQVLTVRAIAEFVGGEHKYSSDISGLIIENTHK